MHASSEHGRLRWMHLIAALGLALVLLLPAMTAAQGIRDREDDPATEEATEEPATEEAPDGPLEEADLEDAGLVGNRSYESPQFQYTVDWSRDWDVDYFYDAPLSSDEGSEQDQLYLIWTGGPDEQSYAIFSGQTANRGGPDGDVEEWTDQDWIDDTWEADFEVEALLDDTTRSSAAVLYSVVNVERGDLQYYTIYQSIELEDGTTLYLTFSAFEDWFEDSYTSWSEDIELNSEPIDVVLDWDDIEDAI